MLRTGSSVAIRSTQCSINVRSFMTSPILCAKAPAPAKGGKKKVAFKPTKEQGVKTKKGGMTHLPFRDAVGALGFEKLATDFAKLELGNVKYGEITPAKVFKYESENTLKTLGSFKKFQYHEMFLNPVTFVSENSVRLSEEFVSKLEGPSKDNRLCLLGEKGSGKSTLITQAQALALSKHENDILVLHIENPEKVRNGSSDYIFNPKTKKYQQPMFTKRWIYKMRQANENLLKKMPLTRDISFQSKRVDYNLKKGTNTLFDFLLHNHDFGKTIPTSAFTFFVEELEAHSKNIPILVSIDDFNSIIDQPITLYRHTDFTSIHLSEFEMGDFILKIAGGQINFAKGGVLLAVKGDKKLSGKNLSVALKQEAHDPYSKIIDRGIVEALENNGGIKAFSVNNLTKSETEQLLRFYQASGVLHVKDYATKDSYKSAEELGQEKAAIRAGKPDQTVINSEEQFDKIVENQYTVSTGNPGFLVQATALSY